MQATAAPSCVVRINVYPKASSRPGPAATSRGETQLAQYVRVSERLRRVRAQTDATALRHAALGPEFQAVAHRRSVALENRRVIRTVVTPVAVGAIGLGAATATLALAVGLPLGLGGAAIAGWRIGRQVAQAAQDARELGAESAGLEMLASDLALEHQDLASREPQLRQAAWREQVDEATGMPDVLIGMIADYAERPAPQPGGAPSPAQAPGS